MQSRTFVRSIKRTSIVLLALYLLYTPLVTYAATKPTCSLNVKTDAGMHTIRSKGTVYIPTGETAEITWESMHAITAERGSGKVIPLSGSRVHTPRKTTTYAYQFNNEESQTICSVKVRVVTGTFNKSSLLNSSTKPTISGSVSGIKSVRIQILKEGSAQPLFTSKPIPVKDGVWKTKVTKKLPKGTYTINLLGEKELLLDTIAQETLRIGTSKNVEHVTGTIVAIPVALLSGGTTRAGSTIPLSYLQVINVGTEAITVQGFTIKQNGSAPTDTITQLSISDDSNTFHNSKNSIPLFKDNTSHIPIEVPIAAGEMRLFTIKATLAPIVSNVIGKQLKIDVIGVASSANIKSVFPIRGTTWTFGI